MDEKDAWGGKKKHLVLFGPKKQEAEITYLDKNQFAKHIYLF